LKSTRGRGKRRPYGCMTNTKMTRQNTENVILILFWKDQNDSVLGVRVGFWGREYMAMTSIRP